MTTHEISQGRGVPEFIISLLVSHKMKSEGVRAD